jgi:exonuclease 3'-5' domain-containing protein 1
MTPAERRSWTTTKQKGLNLAPERGGCYEVFNIRPLADEIIEYCIEDVGLLPRLWEKYNRKMTPRWRSKVIVETRNRVRESQSSTFNGKEKHMTLVPRDWS